MGRVLRKKGALVNGNCEIVSPKPLAQKSKKVTDSSIKPVKTVLSDRTNVKVNNIVNVKCEKTVKFCDFIENQKVKPNLRNSNTLPINCSESPILRKSKRINSVKNPYVLLTPIKFTKNGKKDSEKVNLQRNNKIIFASEEGKSVKVVTFNEKEHFLGFDKAEKSPLLDIVRKQIELCSQLAQPLSTLSKKNHLPVYRLNKPSPPKMCSNNIDDRLHLYDFEIDENEPVVKKGKRKPILKIKRCRTYNRKKKVVSIPKPLNDSNQENICPIVQSNKETWSKGYTPMSPMSERSIPDVFNNSIDDVVDTPIGPKHSNVQNVPHSSSHHSDERDFLCVPIIRSSLSQNNDDNCSKSLNASASSSRHDISVNSIYSANFNSPSLYIGSSTPIHRHWAEQTNNVNSHVTLITTENFDISNNFGFIDVDLVEEPIVSPIKRFETPVRPITPKKPSPIKVSHRQVIRMLKFGPEAPLNTSQEDESLPIDELLPSHFFHDTDTPTFSPSSSPVMPVVRKKGMKNNLNQTVKKKVVIVEDLQDSDFATQSSEDKTSQEEDIRCERTLRSNRPPLRRTRNNQTLSNSKSNQTLGKTRVITYKDDSDIENDKGYETEISPTKQNITTKKSRRSYERPAYLRPNKSGRGELEEDVEEEVVVVKEKPQSKKKNALSKKEEKELEQWAKAFNEQCMQVESFNLVVE